MDISSSLVSAPSMEFVPLSSYNFGQDGDVKTGAQ